MTNKINVNMVPNPSDIKSLHCSQGDVGRKFQFKLHSNGEALDVEDISSSVFEPYPVAVGGTEQILPENTSTPTTTPILANIQYPDELRENQEFTYRECPTEEDGNAKIKTIYGNTLKWNQLVQNGDFSNGTNGWSERNAGALSVANNVATITAVVATNNNQTYQSCDVIVGHKYLIKFKGIQLDSPQFRIGLFNGINEVVAFTSSNIIGENYIFLQPEASANNFRFNPAGGVQIGDVTKITNMQLFDLTAMFGSGNEPQTVEEFTALFPFPYYPYNAGELIPFKGAGIKTVGFNQWDEQWEIGDIDGSTGAEITGTGTSFRCVGYIPVLPNTKYWMTNPFNDTLKTRYYDANKNYLGARDKENRTAIASGGTYFTTADNCCYFRFATQPNHLTYENNICLNIFDENRNGTYKSYEEHLTDLSTLDYFSDGMKSAGDVYDELSNVKTVKRVGSRAYEAGDENDDTVITDGTTTYYVLDEPVETSITTASLVCEDGEIPLKVVDDVLEGESTLDFTSKSGFKDVKIKLEDEDSVAYSALFKLHVERKP